MKKTVNNVIGRPRIEEEIQKKRAISLSNSMANKAKKFGNGSLSDGIRMAISIAGRILPVDKSGNNPK